MDNTYFILSNRSLSIERFQICTWKLIGKDAFVELGVEIKKEKLAKYEQMMQQVEERLSQMK